MSPESNHPVGDTRTVMGFESDRLAGETALAVIGVRLLDTAYMTWRFAALECEAAQTAWAGAFGRYRAAGYFTYCAALDREEAAARDFQRVCELAAPCQSVLASCRTEDRLAASRLL